MTTGGAMRIQSNQHGIVLLGILVLALLVALLGMTMLELAGQEVTSIAGAKELAAVHAVADAAQEMVMAWFHSPHVAPQSMSTLVAKRQLSASGSPSFFDPAGRSQFVGTAARPDLLLDAGATADLFRSLGDLGLVQALKVYAPDTPGLLCTVEAAVASPARPSARHTVVMQLGAVELPALRSGVQIGRDLGLHETGKESIAQVHWGDISVGGNMVVQHLEDIPVKSNTASVTGQRYREMTLHEDRWTEIWAGGSIDVTQPSPAQSAASALPLSVHTHRIPVPGLRQDTWGYETLKRLAIQYGTYVVIDREGLLYPGGIVEPGKGLQPDEFLRSRGVGDRRGLVFIDTLDRTAPHGDNLGLLRLTASYVEIVLVVQGHVMWSPGATGAAITVLSPPPPGGSNASRIPVQMSDLNLNGALYVAGNLSLEHSASVFGAVAVEGTISAGRAGSTLEVWYDHDMGRGLFHGVPIVVRVPGSWMARYD